MDARAVGWHAVMRVAGTERERERANGDETRREKGRGRGAWDGVGWGGMG